MNVDYLSVPAAAPWSDNPAAAKAGREAAKPRRVSRRDTPEQIAFCLQCTVEPCNNCLQYLKKGQLPEFHGATKYEPQKEDPCAACGTRHLCKARGWACREKLTGGKRHEAD